MYGVTVTNDVLIIETIKKAGRPLKPAEISKLSGIGSGTVRTTIRKMLLKGDVYQPFPQHYSVGDTPTVNTLQGIEPHALGNIGLTSVSLEGGNDTDKISRLRQLVYSLIPMQEMKDALERGDEFKTPFQFIFERDFEGDTYKIKFTAEVRKDKKPSLPKPENPTPEEE